MKSSKICAMTVEVLRGDKVECVHNVHLVVMNSKNQIIESYGDPNLKCFPRSAIKLLQAIPFVESGAIEKFNLTEKEIVLSCASHQAEPFHLECLQAWAKKMQIEEADLACGPHLPLHGPSADALKAKDQKPNRWMNNCSGKHLGFLATALMKNESINDYHKLNHPVQQRVIAEMFKHMGLDKNTSIENPWGIDGCGIPTGYFPLQSWVQGLGVFFNSQNAAAQKILKAIQKFPEYLGGSDNLSSDVIKISQGQMIVKSGAEAFFLGFFPALGVSVGFKVEDGSQRAVPAVIQWILKKYSNQDVVDEFEKKYSSKLLNTLDEVVGEVRVSLG